jgi:hypothetical protein
MGIYQVVSSDGGVERGGYSEARRYNIVEQSKT